MSSSVKMYPAARSSKNLRRMSVGATALICPNVLKAINTSIWRACIDKSCENELFKKVQTSFNLYFQRVLFS